MNMQLSVLFGGAVRWIGAAAARHAGSHYTVAAGWRIGAGAMPAVEGWERFPAVSVSSGSTRGFRTTKVGKDKQTGADMFDFDNIFESNKKWVTTKRGGALTKGFPSSTLPGFDASQMGIMATRGIFR